MPEDNAHHFFRTFGLCFQTCPIEAPQAATYISSRSPSQRGYFGLGATAEVWASTLPAFPAPAWFSPLQSSSLPLPSAVEDAVMMVALFRLTA